jgi:carboxymethylenebutenolidase
MNDELSKPCESEYTAEVGRRNLLRSILLATVGVLAASPYIPLEAIARATASPQSSDSAHDEMIQYQSDGATISALMTTPITNGKHPGVLIVHDVGGMNEEVRNMAQKLAGEGFVSLAPDLLSRVGGTDKVPLNQRARTVAQLPSVKSVDDVSAGYEYLARLSEIDSQKISILGLGWGGWRAYRVAEDLPVYKVVIYCGTTPTEGLSNIKAPVLANYAQYDFRVTGNAIWTETNLGQKFTYYVYPKTQRTSFYQNAAGYDAAAAKQAWQRTLDFLKS